MNMIVTTYKHAKGFGFQVESADGMTRVRSDYKPFASGNVAMTEEEARAEGEAHAAIIRGDVAPPAAAEETTD